MSLFSCRFRNFFSFTFSYFYTSISAGFSWLDTHPREKRCVHITQHFTDGRRCVCRRRRRVNTDDSLASKKNSGVQKRNCVEFLFSTHAISANRRMNGTFFLKIPGKIDVKYNWMDFISFVDILTWYFSGSPPGPKQKKDKTGWNQLSWRLFYFLLAIITESRCHFQ
jgi:hypothetical protein